ncbi:hypothetical protein [Kingella potus]|uniref:hypothetical protein n=1 Tax=Kingella potus TaxID=265175 RepID=UPI001FD40097|nr:hypothetical protein [Kingella potus]UOP01283.1 hypothetical protein LVJ84_03210 [Kingella potus]
MSNKQPEWEKKLQKLREKRDAQPAGSSTAEAAAPPHNRRIHDGYRKQIMQNYLQNWQNRHNAALAGELTDADAAVLLEEDWLNAQNALQGMKTEEVLAKQTVWFSPKPVAATDAGSGGGSGAEQAEAAFCPQDVPVSVNVLDPQGVPVGTARYSACRSRSWWRG